MWSRFATPMGMSRRHFMSHMAGAATMLGSSLSLGHSLRVHADTLKANRKSCILLWMGGGPSSMDAGHYYSRNHRGAQRRGFLLGALWITKCVVRCNLLSGRRPDSVAAGMRWPMAFLDQ